MTDIFGFAKKRVVVSGCYSGMGRATAELLFELGAEVHGLDYKPVDYDLASFTSVDLRDEISIDAAAAAISTDPVDALFNCAGLGPTFSPIDIMKVNFIGTRHLTERLLPSMREGAAIGSIASTAAMGWSRRVAIHKTLLDVTGFNDAVQWAESHADEVSEGYSFSKETIVVWTMMRSQDLIARGIRINCIMPGLTQTPMLTDQIAVNTSAAVLDDVVQPSGRPGLPVEQAFALVAITSPAASYINGAALNVDGGRLARVAMGMGSAPNASSKN